MSLREYPGALNRSGSKDDTANYVLLVKTLKANFSKSGRDLGITFTAPSSFWYLRWINLVGMLKYSNWVNLMSYDLHGTWDSTNPISSIVQAYTNLTQIKSAMNLFWRVKIPPRQIALGFGFYNRAFTLSDPSCTTLGCPFSGGAKPGPCTATSGYLAYYEIQDILAKNLGIKVNNQWILYDNKDTFKQKITWTNSIGLSGSLIWVSDLDDFAFTAHAGLTGKTISKVGSQLSKKQVQAQQMTTSDLDSYLVKNCYVQPDSLTSCKAGDTQKKDYKPICCPKASGMTECQWRGGTGGTNAGRDCNGQCHSGEVMITQSGYGGTPGESSETAHCTKGKKAFCCQMGSFTDLFGQCHWTSKVSSICDNKTKQKDKPPPLLDCRWVGKGDCADNTYGGSEVTLLTDEREDTYGGCSWGRKKSLCCTPNPEALLTESCDLDLCSLIENRAACEDEAGYNDELGISSLNKRSYITSDGKTLWTYDNVDNGDSDKHWNYLEGRVVPGGARQKILQLKTLLGTPIYGAKELVLTSRPYWPGLKSLKGDGSKTLVLKGGFSLLKDQCASTAVKYIPQASLPKTGFQMEHMREINMLNQFAQSLITGFKVSGEKMKNTFDPLAVVAGWNKYYKVSLPQIGATVKDTIDYTIPRTFNDRAFETIGSYAYQAEVSFVPGPLNLAKKVVLIRQSPLRTNPAKFLALVNKIANAEDEMALKKLLGSIQLVNPPFLLYNLGHRLLT
ncbi:hypothetical protein DSL72_001499 [Monilinia vaccinii-corymbosi]|uniref:chitinase n=1 Tax=Monilinia vaccinii-corymbosi TaxID=61207 RepID=A0A8A3P4Z3_9HELO|nr:hypothetical protein DSL72_001499 [Monilinia vaccinii-corymbosi]